MRLSCKRGQGMVTEYLTMIIIAVGAAAAMVVFLQRGFQGRVRDGVNNISEEARAAAPGINILRQYEPYYTLSNTKADAGSEGTEKIAPDRSAAAFTMQREQTGSSDQSADSQSVQLAPKDAD